MKKLALHWRILIGMVLGVSLGLLMAQFTWGSTFVKDWVAPFGTIFINLLKLITVPLVVASLLKGIGDLKHISKFSRLGGRTVILYLFTTFVAVILGLLVVNIFQPGNAINPDTITQLAGDAAPSDISDKTAAADRGPLQFFVEIVPDNIFGALGSNRSMLQVIFFTVFFGISLLLVPPKHQKPIMDFFNGINEVVLKMVNLIMLVAPYAVFVLIAGLVVDMSSGDLFFALLNYAFLVIGGFALLIGFHTLLVYLFTGRSPKFFLRGIFPAQLVAFSTSSSMATLPVTMECVEERLGVEKEVTSFVCPVGATINMDGSGFYQAVAAVFVCQILGHDLALTDQFIIVITATLASIGAPAAPSAGIIILIIVLESVGFPAESLPIALAMIFAIDRPLDMCRTVVNITGDSCVSMLVGKSLGALKTPDTT